MVYLSVIIRGTELDVRQEFGRNLYMGSPVRGESVSADLDIQDVTSHPTVESGAEIPTRTLELLRECRVVRIRSRRRSLNWRVVEGDVQALRKKLGLVGVSK